MGPNRRLILILALAAGSPVAAGQGSEQKVEFAVEIQPLFAEHCVKCHGPEKQKGGLRLDAKDLAMRGGDEGKVIEPGRSDDSRLVHFVEGRDPEKVMPAKGGRLTPGQIAVVRRWIDEGAEWPDDGGVARVRSEHWSLQPLVMPAVPAVEGAATELDAFVQEKLADHGMVLSAPADRPTLIRRLSFDLLGLPPTPEEIAAFVSDASPRAYETLVERLLASPQYGERWGRHWLDVARYTESQGFEYDRLRDNAWHYRDYVIRSFNDDKPYDRFMREQVAGDVIEPVTNEGIIGPSLLVCGAWDQAGNSQQNATQRAITRENELEDVIGVVGQTFLGLTINCARCHSHKFDPIPQEDYYRMKSIFEGVKHGERPLNGSAQDGARKERLAALDKELAAAREEVAKLEAEAWKAAAARHSGEGREPGPAAFARWVFDGPPDAVMPGEPKGGARIEGGQLVLPAEGAYYQTAVLPKEIGEKTLEAWVSLADLQQGGGAAISIESGNGVQFDAVTFGEREPRKWAAGSDGFRRTQDLEGAEEGGSPGAMIHVAVVYRADNSIAVFRNGEPYGKPYRPSGPLQVFKAGDGHVLLGMRHQGGGRPWLTGAIRQAALYDRALSAAEVAASFRSSGFSIPQSEVLAQLGEAQRVARDAALAAAKKAGEERRALDVAVPTGKTYAGNRDQPAPTRFLARGDVNSPRHVVTPGALSAVVDLEPDFGLAADAPEAQRRLKFADWLADGRNPLPARVMANRVWHLHFGRGLVLTPNDFGVSGARPSHRELLDWLAVQFMRSGWSVKALHRVILNSATYRQSSAFDGKAAATDVDNELLWRFPPRRLEGEAVRDAMLAVSGQLNPTAGGPGFRPFTITDFGASFYHLVDRPEPEFNRRTVYRMNVNSGKDPLMEAFDCPDPSVKTPRRGVTTTPLQALELMNNPFVLRQAEHLAERAMAGAGNDMDAAVRAAYLLALGRPPTAEETSRAAAVANEHGLKSACWALLNSTEFLYVN